MFEKEENGVFRNWMFLLGDLISLQFSLLISYAINSRVGSMSMEKHFVYMSILAAGTSFLVAFFDQNYKGILKRGYFKEFVKTSYFTSVVFFITISLFFFLKISAIFSRLFIGIWGLASLIIVYVSRLIIKNIVSKSKKYTNRKNLIIIADTKDMQFAFDEVLKKLNASHNVVAVGFLENSSKKVINNLKAINGKEEIISFVLKNSVDEVLITEKSYFGKSEFVDKLLEMGITVHYDLDNLNLEVPNAIVSSIGEVNVVTVCINTISERSLFIKRTMDVIGSFVGILISIPFALIVVPIIYFNSPGNVIFKQKRVGRNGRIFYLYKFRSMYMDAEERKAELMENNEMDGFMFKMDNDPRITPIGKFIRKTSIDELPQFINVFKGDMSLVGTRPPTVDEYEKYELHHKSRLAMRPGITGMWQVEGRGEVTDFEEVVKLDRRYIDNWNLGLDIKLLIKTVGVVFKSKGAK